jgi:hypothetical protein
MLSLIVFTTHNNLFFLNNFNWPCNFNDTLLCLEIAIGKLKSYKSPCTDNIPAKLIKAGGETLYSEIHRLICCIWNKEELPQQWKESITVPIYKKGNKNDCNNY